MSTPQVRSTPSTAADQRWINSRKRARIDVTCKVIFLATITAINVVILAGVFAAIVMFCPIPMEALIASPFIIGVFIVLGMIKFPTLGVNHFNYYHFTNPLILVGGVIAFVCFGTTILTFRQLDLTSYSNGDTAKGITDALKEGEFKDVKHILKHHKNLKRYGFVDQSTDNIKNLYQEYKALEPLIEISQANGVSYTPIADDDDDDASVTSSDSDDDDFDYGSLNQYRDTIEQSHLTETLLKESSVPVAQREAVIMAYLENKWSAIQKTLATELPSPRACTWKTSTWPGWAATKIHGLYLSILAPKQEGSATA